jgi:hypothetical protein
MARKKRAGHTLLARLRRRLRLQLCPSATLPASLTTVREERLMRGEGSRATHLPTVHVWCHARSSQFHEVRLGVGPIGPRSLLTNT